jgi:bifunctional UDP-N-acetylglucosamine pyrophosphorylase/glucosamine-1-phosphate N-acetyltransferase
MNFSAVILAAGKGTRMKSDLPKVAHMVAGRPIIQHVIDAVRSAGSSEVILVLGFGREIVCKTLDNQKDLHIAVQEQQL